jgi:hypothetical protein
MEGDREVTVQARFRQVDIQRALKAARKSGFDDVRVRIGVDGGIEVIVGTAANDQPPVELE